LIPVDGHDNFYRDPNSGAIINTNKSDFEKYKAISKNRNKFDEKIESTAKEVSALKTEITEIKQLLLKLVDGINTWWYRIYLMLAAVTNLVVYQGSDFQNTFFVTNDNGSQFNLTGFSGECLIKKHYSSSSSTTMQVNINPQENSGSVTIALTNSVTASMTPGRYVYDVVLTDSSGIKSRVLEGILTVVEGVTL